MPAGSGWSRRLKVEGNHCRAIWREKLGRFPACGCSGDLDRSDGASQEVPSLVAEISLWQVIKENRHCLRVRSRRIVIDHHQADIAIIVRRGDAFDPATLPGQTDSEWPESVEEQERLVARFFLRHAELFVGQDTPPTPELFVARSVLDFKHKRPLDFC